MKDLIYQFMSGDMQFFNALWMLALPIVAIYAAGSALGNRAAERKRRQKRIDAMLERSEREAGKGGTRPSA